MSGRNQVFVSFKNLDDAGRPTPDSRLAVAVYEYLTARGLGVFFSNVSLERRGVAAFKQAIDDALEAADVLVAVETSRANLMSRWVRYECDTFSNEILSGVKPNGRVFAYI